jgi:hypothetical protein
MNENKDATENLGSSRCSPALIQEVVSILRERGIEATPQQVCEWADKMVADFNRMRGKHSDARQWMAGVKRNMRTPTMCLHLHFGDAR